MRFLCIYMAPDVAKESENVTQLCDCIRFYKKERPIFYVFGDFNLPLINWKNLNTTNCRSNIFLEYCISEGLEQFIDEPTRKESTIDLLLCDEIASRRLTDVQILPPLTSTCDHSLIEFQVTVKNKKSNVQPNATYDYNNGDYESINNQLS